MPKVTTKDGKVRHFAYTKKGAAQAKAFAKASGGKMQMDMKSTMKRKVGKKKKAKKGLYYNINQRKKKGISRPKSKSTISAKAYKRMKEGFKKKK